MNTSLSLGQILLRKGRYSILSTPAPIWVEAIPVLLLTAANLACVCGVCVCVVCVCMCVCRAWDVLRCKAGSSLPCYLIENLSPEPSLAALEGRAVLPTSFLKT